MNVTLSSYSMKDVEYSTIDVFVKLQCSRYGDITKRDLDVLSGLKVARTSQWGIGEKLKVAGLAPRLLASLVMLR